MLRGFLLLLLLLTAAFFSPAQTISRNAPYSNLDTGVTFPVELAGFRKTTVRINQNPVVGTRIHYSGCEGKCLATIFIYALSENPVPITDAEFEQHCRFVRQTILDQAKQTRRSSNANALQITEVESIRQSRSTEDGMIVFREKFLAHSDKEETFHTEVVLFRLGDLIVKLRISVPTALTDANRNADDFVMEFCRLFCRGKDPVFKPISEETPAAAPEK